MRKASYYYTVVSKELHTPLASVKNVKEKERTIAAAAKLLADSEKIAKIRVQGWNQSCFSGLSIRWVWEMENCFPEYRN